MKFASFIVSTLLIFVCTFLVISPVQAAHVAVFVFDAITGDPISDMLVVVRARGAGGVQCAFTHRGVARMAVANSEMEQGRRLVVNAPETYVTMNNRQKAVHREYVTDSWDIRGVGPIDEYGSSTIYVAINPRGSCGCSFMSRTLGWLITKMRNSTCGAHEDAEREIPSQAQNY